MNTITVFKRNHLGAVVWQYTGTLVSRGESWLCIDAVFGRSDVDAGYVVFRRGDVMREWFYSDRWYNVFRIESKTSGQLKGWYCNITRPAELGENSVAADDLALDVFIRPTGEVLVLDEDEFEGLELPPEDRRQALAAVDALRAAVHTRSAPFNEIPNP